MHGFLALSETQVEYACGDMYAPDFEGSIYWNDDTLGIQWPLPGGVQPIVSEKIQAAKKLADIKDQLHWPEDVYSNLIKK